MDDFHQFLGKEQESKESLLTSLRWEALFSDTDGP